MKRFPSVHPPRILVKMAGNAGNMFHTIPVIAFKVDKYNIYRWIDGQKDRQTHRQINRIDRQTDRHVRHTRKTDMRDRHARQTRKTNIKDR